MEFFDPSASAAPSERREACSRERPACASAALRSAREQTASSGGRPRDRAHMLAVGLVGFFAFLDVYVTQPLLPLLARRFHASELAVSLTVSAVTLAIALSAPLTGLLADRVGRKRVIVGALALLAAPTLLAAQAGSLDGLVRWRFLQGLMIPGIFVVAIAYVAEEWAPRRATLAMAVYVIGTVLGGTTGRVVAGFITAAWGWRAAFAALGALTLVGAALVWRLLPGASGFARQESLRAATAAALAHLRNPRLLATFFVGFNMLFMLVAAFTYVNFDLAAAPFHLGAAELGLIYFAYLPSLLFLTRAGRWTARVGYRRALMVALLVSAGGAVLTLWAFLPAILLGLALTSGGLFSAQSTATSYLGHEAREARSSAAGLYAALYYIGGSLGGLAPGFLWARWHWFGCVLLVLIADAAALALGWRYWPSGAVTGHEVEVVGVSC